jgi:hypothetical protein
MDQWGLVVGELFVEVIEQSHQEILLQRIR